MSAETNQPVAERVENPVKRLFMTLTEGVYVIGAASDGKRDAFTASSVMQVSLQPPMVAVAVNPENASFALLRDSGAFAITVLQSYQIPMAGFFGANSGREEDKLAQVQWHMSPGGAPVLDEGMSFFDCRVVATHPVGDHVLVVATVAGGDFLQPRSRPLRYDELEDLDGSGELMPSRLENPVSEIHQQRR